MVVLLSPYGLMSSVSGGAKPASDGRAKTGHFEELEICPLPLAFGSRRRRMVRWRINSRWRKFRQFWHLREAAGRNRHIARQLAFTARRSGGIFALALPRRDAPGQFKTGQRAHRLGRLRHSSSGGAPTGVCRRSACRRSRQCRQLPWREVIVQKLETGLTAQRIYQDLCSDHGYTGSYYSVRRLVRKLTATMPAPFRRMECEPGAEAQVDFGRGAPIVGR